MVSAEPAPGVTIPRRRVHCASRSPGCVTLRDVAMYPREPEPPQTREQVRLEIEIARARSGTKCIDPRVVAAQSRFALGGW